VTNEAHRGVSGAHEFLANTWEIGVEIIADISAVTPLPDFARLLLAFKPLQPPHLHAYYRANVS
jgi:hypothetical protein